MCSLFLDMTFSKQRARARSRGGLNTKKEISNRVEFLMLRIFLKDPMIQIEMYNDHCTYVVVKCSLVPNCKLCDSINLTSFQEVS